MRGEAGADVKKKERQASKGSLDSREGESTSVSPQRSLLEVSMFCLFVCLFGVFLLPVRPFVYFTCSEMFGRRGWSCFICAPLAPRHISLVKNMTKTNQGEMLQSPSHLYPHLKAVCAVETGEC